jgi:hypothetical protein
VASLYPKKISGKTYWYLREMGRVAGKPKMVSERYLGTAAEIEALLEAREQAVVPDKVRHLAFGDVAAAFRQLKDPHVVSFAPMHHWTDHNIRVHTFTCVLALQIAHLMRYQARRAGLHLSVRALLDELEHIGETVLLYQGERGRPKARRMLTETTPTQQRLSEIFGLDRYAPRRPGDPSDQPPATS